MKNLLFPNQMRYQAAPLPDFVFPRGMNALAQAKRHGAALIGTERSRWGSRGHAGCTPGNHKCVALMLAFFDALDGATVTGITERAVAECEQRMKETSDE